MLTSSEQPLDKTQAHISELLAALQSGVALQPLRWMLNGLSPVEIARLLESSPPPSRQVLWSIIDENIRGEVLQELSDEVGGQFLKAMDSQKVAEITQDLDADDVADMLQQLPDQATQEVLSAMTEQNRARIQTVLSYEKDTAGGLMNMDVIAIRPRFTLDVVLRYLRRHDFIPPSTDQLIVVNASNIFLGTLSMSKLLTSDPDITVRELMRTDIDPIPVTMSNYRVAQLFERNNWISAPVVNETGRVVGRITIDDVVDVIIEDADHSFMSIAGLDEDEDTFAPLSRTAPRRAIWLGINLLTAILASSVINIFQDTIDKVVALAVLMPIVASMGGVAGSQTLTVVIRGMALGKIGPSNRGWLLSREIINSLINGLLWACVLALIAAFWFKDIRIALILGIAIIINLLVAAVGGALLPSLLKALKIDPALAGGVVLTTLTDVMGFLSFLGLATLFYL
jgi:magnesium transporter